MEVMESPVEALVLVYSVTAVTSLWTCLAVFTAAFGLWRIRTNAFLSASKRVVNVPTTTADARPTPPPPPTEMTKCQIAFPKKGTVFKDIAFGEDESPRLLPSNSGVKWRSEEAYSFRDLSSSTHDDDDKEEEEEEHDDGVELTGSFRDQTNYGVNFVEQKSEIVRNQLVELYRFQDWTALNGSVVKLWDKDLGLRRRRWSEW